ncbi:MAG: hypothetical protein IJC73_03680 [Lentisphaeria bacterium]|nr:hypothetical protein [Lentisphaeria bacterium]
MSKIVVSAGPTRESLDDIRFLSNRSSGKMGYALAAAARAAGFDTVLVSGPTALTPPDGVRTIQVESAAEMAEAVKREAADADAVIMAAAVADYRPAEVFDGKMKKQPGDLVLRLERTEDILLSLGRVKRSGQRLIGFAAEADSLEHYALDKLQRKNLDWIAANRIGHGEQGFGADRNAVILFSSTGKRIPVPLAGKAEIARRIIEICLLDRP